MNIFLSPSGGPRDVTVSPVLSCGMKLTCCTTFDIQNTIAIDFFGECWNMYLALWNSCNGCLLIMEASFVSRLICLIQYSLPVIMFCRKQPTVPLYCSNDSSIVRNIIFTLFICNKLIYFKVGKIFSERATLKIHNFIWPQLTQNN